MVVCWVNGDSVTVKAYFAVQWLPDEALNLLQHTYRHEVSVRETLGNPHVTFKILHFCSFNHGLIAKQDFYLSLFVCIHVVHEVACRMDARIRILSP
jgi:hypothetical protein